LKHLLRFAFSDDKNNTFDDLMKIIRIFLKILGGLILLSIVFVIVASILATFSNYTPPAKEILIPVGTPATKQITENRIRLMSWNIGYAGLGRQMDFFYDGGNQVRPAHGYYNECFAGIETFLLKSGNIDFMLLQEVDKKARRSFKNNQVEKISSLFPDHQSVFAKNYDVLFVPVPVNNPMGKVVAGMMNLSKSEAVTNERISFPGNYSWPKSIFLLDRCFIIQRFVVNDENVLTLINTHNSAFDDGSLRKQQFDLLRETALEEFAKGHYVIIGGDWNQNPPGFNPEQIQNGDVPGKNDLPNVPDDFMPPGWKWAFDPSVPTNRDVSEPYKKGKTSATILDYFLISPNLQLLNVKTIDLAFKDSDHNPVVMDVRFGED
jgi:endonuclease/exonuclease/phosphatase family metal-dependent hydrolase